MQQKNAMNRLEISVNNNFKTVYIDMKSFMATRDRSWHECLYSIEDDRGI